VGGVRSPVGGHALVLGASIAGLATSATLADRFERVTLVEADRPDPGAEGRHGVPQGRHAHLLLPGGLRALEALVPGFADRVRRRGGHVIPAPEFRFHLGKGRLALGDDRLAITGATRPLLESVLRDEVAALPAVTVLHGHHAEQFVTDDARSRVVGARVTPAGGATTAMLGADLVVDATGRRSRTAPWLASIGYRPPLEQRIAVGVHYTTRLFRREPTDLGGCRHVAIAAPPGVRHGGLALAVEGERWLVTLVGTVGERPPTDLESFVDYATHLWQPDLGQLVAQAEPIGGAATGGFPAHRRLRYDRLRRIPEGLVVTGDAVCSLNPVHGQGMSVAALEAQALGEVLDRHGLDRVGPRTLRRARPTVDAAWTMATGADLQDPGVEGRRGIGWRTTSRYLRRALAAATTDAEVADALLAVNGMVRPPTSLFAPRLARRVMGPRTERRPGEFATLP
jgi:2-polyprenyl-6-methoxyphenol hydroxylase-like FAD-dependent oxidoreductase